MPDFIHESNIFGQVTQTSSLPASEPASTATTTAGKLADHLRYVADSYALLAANKADWLSIAAVAGQNDGSTSIVRAPLTKPSDIQPAALVSGWNLPQLPSLISLPALPDDLKVDIDKIKSTWTPDLQALQQSWMAQYLPAVTDVSALNGLFSSVLNGSAQTTFEARLNGLEAAISAALTGITASTLATINGLVTAVQAAISSNVTTQQGNIASALQTAQDGTQQVAWQRAKDQVSREAKRIEDETLTTFASKGFSLPAGILLSALAHQRQQTLEKSVEIASVQAEKVQGFLLEIAKVTIDSWQRTMELQNRAQLEQFRMISEFNLKVADQQLDATKYQAELAVKHLGLTLDFTKFAGETAVKYRLGVIDGMNNLIRAYGALRGVEVEYVRGVAAAKAQMMGALVEYYRAAIASVEVGLRVGIANQEKELRYIAEAASFIGTAVGHHVQAAGVSAEAFAKIAAAAIEGLRSVTIQQSTG